jgi:hypothetical protein
MKRSIIVIFVIISLIGLFIYYIAGITHRMDESVKTDAIKTITTCPEDYSNLFNENKDLVFNETDISKTRNPIAQFTYNNKFRMFVYRVNSARPISLDTGINDSYIGENMSHNFIYGRFGEFDQFDFLFKRGTQDKVSKVYLNIQGLQTQTIKKNGTLAYYYSRFRNFSIKYNSEAAQDFFGSVKDSVSDNVSIPIEIMFLERKKNLYLVILTSTNNKIDLAPGTLMNLIKK